MHGQTEVNQIHSMMVYDDKMLITGNDAFEIIYVNNQRAVNVLIVITLNFMSAHLIHYLPH